MASRRLLGWLHLLLLCSGVSLAATWVAPPAPSDWVTDQVGFLSAPVRRSLNERLSRYEKETGRQVIVWVGSTTEGVPLEEWAVRTFEAWGIGHKGKDDGLALFVFASERRLRIEVGYGLEGLVPDAVANRIIQEEAVPRLRAGDADGAISATVSTVLAALGGEGGAAPQRPQFAVGRRGAPLSLGQLILFGVLGLALLIFVVTHPRLALLFLVQMMNSNRSHRGGWGGGGGGGFGGGGGRSGGGGASGSW